MFKLGLLLTAWAPNMITTVGLKLNSTAAICASHKSYGNKYIFNLNFDSRVWYYNPCKDASNIDMWLCGGSMTTNENKCHVSEYRCKDGTCILNYYRCDGDNDCLDGSDELHCTPSCTSGYGCLADCSAVLCRCHIPYVKFLGKCMILSFVLSNSSPDTRTFIPLDYPTLRLSNDVRNCWQQKWASCDDGSHNCYPMELRCTFQRDIYGDPLHCPNTEHLRYCFAHECPTMFKCNNSFCIPLQMVCDLVGDCPALEDENNCENMTCPGMLKCKKSLTCVHPRNVCDGIPHCKYSLDDELLCNVTKCPVGCQCYGQATVCSGATFFNLSSFSTLSTVLVFNNVTFPVVKIVSFINIMYLSLSQCNLLDINLMSQPFANLQSLQYLQISYHNLHVLRSYNFRFLSNLHQLILSGNVLTVMKSFAFQGLSHIPYLNLSWLQIEQLHDCTFCYLSNVVEIDLSYNNLVGLTREMFHGVPNLEQLNVVGNHLRHVSTDVFVAMSGVSRLHVYTDVHAVCCFVSHNDRCLNQNRILNYSCVKLVKSSIVQSAASFIILVIVCLTIIVVSYYRNLTLQFLLIQHLTVCDFIYATYISVILVYNFIHGKHFNFFRDEWHNSSLCSILGTVFMTSLLCSQYASCLISFNVLIATKFALKILNISKMPFVIAIVLGWAISSLGGVVNYLYNEAPRTTLCIPSYNVFTIPYTILFTIFVLITLTNHCLIIQVVYNSTSRIRRTKRVSIKTMTIKFAITFLMGVVTLISIISQTLSLHYSYTFNEVIVMIILPCNFFCNFVIHTLLRMLHTYRKNHVR